MKTYFISKTEFSRVIHGNRSIKIQEAIKINEPILFWCIDRTAYSAPIQAIVKTIYTNSFKTKNVEGVSQFPFPTEIKDTFSYQRARISAFDYFKNVNKAKRLALDLKFKELMSVNEQKHAKHYYAYCKFPYWLWYKENEYAQLLSHYRKIYKRDYPVNDESNAELLNDKIEFIKYLKYLIASEKIIN